MNLKLAGLCSVAMLACAAATPQASAGTLSWNFFTLNGGSAGDSYPGYDMGSPAAQWTQSTTVLSADAGVQCGANNWCQGSEDLYAKNGGSPSEQGLGLTSDLPDNEISNPYGIGLWLNNGHFTSVTIGSLQAGESWSVWGQTMEGSWTELAAGINNGSGGDVVTYNLPVLNNYTGVVVSDPYASNQTGGTSSNDIVLMSVTSDVPEPATLALFAAGLAGLAFALRRRARQSRSAS